MVTLITLISGRKGFDNLKKTLVNLEPDWKIGLNILCLVSDENIFPEVRNYLVNVVNRGECLIEYVKNGTLKSGEPFLSDKKEFVFLLDENIVLPFRGLSKLVNNYVEKSTAGVISGIVENSPNFFWVENIYDEFPDYKCSDRKLEDYALLENVDICPSVGMLTEKSLYREFFCSEDLESYGENSFCIKLRRRGYMNYVNTGVKYKQGGIE